MAREDGTEPWRTSPVHNGWVCTAGGFEQAYERDDVVWYESRAFDDEGNLIDTGDVLAPQQVDTWVDPGSAVSAGQVGKARAGKAWSPRDG